MQVFCKSLVFLVSFGIRMVGWIVLFMGVFIVIIEAYKILLEFGDEIIKQLKFYIKGAGCCWWQYSFFLIFLNFRIKLVIKQ